MSTFDHNCTLWTICSRQPQALWNVGQMRNRTPLCSCHCRGELPGQRKYPPLHWKPAKSKNLVLDQIYIFKTKTSYTNGEQVEGYLEHETGEWCEQNQFKDTFYYLTNL